MHDSIVRLWLNLNSYVNSIRSGRRPPRQLLPELIAEFTLNEEIPQLQWYLNDIKVGGLQWTTRSRWWNQKKVERRANGYYKQTDTFLYDALDEFPLRGKDVVIVGSEMPWYECICTHYGARVTTLEYRDVDCRIPSLTVMTPEVFARSPGRFDVAFSISSIEHDGLGRYGDPINPVGDLRAMNEFKDLLKPNGLLILSVPVGRDVIVWNAHRIYGPRRFPMLLDGWTIVASYGFQDSCFQAQLGDYSCQPVFVLKANDNSCSA